MKKHIKKAIEEFKKRPFSWSNFSSYNYNKEDWFKKYIKKQRGVMSKALIIGKDIDEQYEKGELKGTSLKFDIRQHEAHFKLGDIQCFSKLDGFTPAKEDGIYHCGEMKTANSFDKWNQKLVDEFGQITFYSLGLLLDQKIHPDKQKWYLWVYVKEEDGAFNTRFVNMDKPLVFHTKRTMKQLLDFASQIKTTYKEMLLYIEQKLLEEDKLK